MAARLTTRFSLAVRRRLTLIGVTFGQRARDVPRGVLVVVVVAGVLAGQQNVPRMVIIVVPLCAIVTGGRVLVGGKQRGAIVVVLQHDMDVPAAFARERADGFAQRAQDLRFARRDDRMHG